MRLGPVRRQPLHGHAQRPIEQPGVGRRAQDDAVIQPERAQRGLRVSIKFPPTPETQPE